MVNAREGITKNRREVKACDEGMEWSGAADGFGMALQSGNLGENMKRKRIIAT